MDLAKRSQEWNAQQFDAAVELYRDMPAIRWQDLYKAFIQQAQESIRLTQELITEDSKIRDRVSPQDLETLELIWNSIDLEQAIIKAEMQNIAEYRQEATNAGK